MIEILSAQNFQQQPQSVAEIMEQYPIDSSFSALDFGKSLLIQSADIIQQSLLINQQYQPFDLTPEIQTLLQSLEKIPHYFSWFRRFFYRLPIIGFYFSPLRHIDQIRQGILQQITAFNNLLKVQIIQVQRKSEKLSQLSSYNQILLLENKNYQFSGEKILKRINQNAPNLHIKKTSLEAQLTTLKVNQLSLAQHAEQITQSLKRLNHYLAEMNFIHQSLFPLWQKQLKLIHDIVINREQIKLLQAPISTQKFRETDTKKRAEKLSQLEHQTIDDYHQDQFDLSNIKSIQQETVNALKMILEI